jgi:putative tryptophan/tyrosine transport system substrate-binding protein
MQRRDFIKGIVGSAAILPLPAHSGQPRLPVVGLLSNFLASNSASLEAALREGLRDAGYLDGQDLEIVHSQSGGQLDRLSGMATELVEKGAAVIIAVDRDAVLAVKTATATIPIVAIVGDYPMRAGQYSWRFLTESDLYRPGSNVTGLSLYGYECERQLYASLCRMVPKQAKFTVQRDEVSILSRSDPSAAALWLHEKYPVLYTDSQHHLDVTFIYVDELDVRVIFNVPDRRGVGDDRVKTLPEHILRHATGFAEYVRRCGLQIDNWRIPTEVAGSTDFGPGYADACRQAGTYVGRILNGAQSSDLPVLNSAPSKLIIRL